MSLQSLVLSPLQLPCSFSLLLLLHAAAVLPELLSCKFCALWNEQESIWIRHLCRTCTLVPVGIKSGFCFYTQSKFCFSDRALHGPLAFCWKEKRGGVASWICVWGTEGSVLDSTALFFHSSTALCLHLHSWPCNYCEQVTGLAVVPHPGILCNFTFTASSLVC